MYNEPEEEVLTPSHLIYGRLLRSMPDEKFEPDDYINKDTSYERFKHLTRTLKHLWNRWRREYLVNLREFHREKVGSYGESKADVGDVVTVFEEDVKRNRWKLDVVEELIDRSNGPSHD